MSSQSDTQELLRFVGSVAGESRLRVEEDLGSGFVVLRVSEAERRQAQHDIRRVEDIVIELLRNARDAGARHIFVASSKEAHLRSIVVIDDGDGIPADLHERIFDARVTSKLDSFHLDLWGVHGRGMALFSIKQNAQEAKVAASDVQLGTSLMVRVNTEIVPERADQSTWPELGIDDEGTQSLIKGPHNIVRSCLEFALEERDSCKVYLGSPAEIVATLCFFGAQQSCDVKNLLGPEEELPLVMRPACASTAKDLVEIAHGLGLDMSERNAQRVLSDTIEALPDLCQALELRSAPRRASKPKAVDLMRDRRGLRIAEADYAEFTDRLVQDFELLCERYYLEPRQAPRLKLTHNCLTVSFEFEKID